MGCSCSYTFFILCVWASAFVGFSMATLLSDQTMLQTNYPAAAPSIAQAPFTRRLGRHGHHQQHKLVKSSEAPYNLSPSAQPDHNKVEKPVNEGSSVEASSGEAGLSTSERHVIVINHHHHSFDKSVAGGGVILGGLATMFVVAVLCYIRATGRHSGSVHKGETASASASATVHSAPSP